MKKNSTRFVWNFESVKILIELWKERKHDLQNNKRNFHIIQDMQKQLQLNGITTSIDHIKSKMHNLTTKFRHEKKMIGPFGESPSEWALFDDMKDIYESNKNRSVSDELMQESYCGLSSPVRSISVTPSALVVSSRSTSSLSTRSKKIKKDSTTEILNKIEFGIQTMNKFIKNSEEIDKQILLHGSQLIEIEERKLEIFEKIFEENKKFNDLLLLKL